MATFRKVHTAFWSDSFTQELTPEQRYFYLYLLTNENTTQCGIYEITKRKMCFDTGYNIDTICKYLEFFTGRDKVRYNVDTCEIAIKNWRKYNDQTSPKVQACINKEVIFVKDDELLEYMDYKKHNIVVFNSNYRVSESVRKAVFLLSDNKCQKCKSEDNLSIDHIIPRSIGGKSFDGNLRCLCRSCNSSRPLVGIDLINEVTESGFDFNKLYKESTGFDNYEYSIGSQSQENKNKNKNKKENKMDDLSLQIINSNFNRQPTIPTKQQVWEIFSRSGGTKEMAKSFYEKHEAMGWFIGASPIVNIPPLANKFIDSWKRNEESKKPVDSTKVKIVLK